MNEIEPSHNGQTFQPNPNYTQVRNDRDYANAANQAKIVNYGSRAAFDPSFLITDNPDASNGPPVIDAAGQVLGGNGRTMTLQRVYSGNPKGAAAYKELLQSKASQFGLDPAAVRSLQRPVLVREIPDSEFRSATEKQNAVTRFNVKPTAELTPAERAISDSRGVSTETHSDLAGRLDAAGEDGTLSDILSGKSGTEVLGRLIDDGVITPQERAAFEDRNGLTKAGRDRIGQLMIGKFFRDPAQMEGLAPSLRQKLERIAAPVAQAETKPGWSLTSAVQDAVDILDRAARLHVANIDDFIAQDGLFGHEKYSSEGIALAKAIKTEKPLALRDAFRQYAGDAAYSAKGANTLFGDAPTPERSFSAAFPSRRNSLSR